MNQTDLVAMLPSSVFVSYVGKGHGDPYKTPTKEEIGKLTEERDDITFADLKEGKL